MSAQPETLRLKRIRVGGRLTLTKLTSHFSPWLGLGLAFLIWWLFTSPLWGHEGLAARFAPEQAWSALRQSVEDGVLWPHIKASLYRVTVSLGLAVLLGVPLGILVGLFSGFERGSSALFQFLRMISPLSWMPVAVMVLGIGEEPVLFLLIMAALWPIVINTAAGVHGIDRRWLLLARGFCATPLQLIVKIIAPAIVTSVLTGIRLAIGTIWIVLVPAEMLGVSEGLGYYVLDTRDRLSYPELMAAILAIGSLGYLLDFMAQQLIRRWTHRQN